MYYEVKLLCIVLLKELAIPILPIDQEKNLFCFPAARNAEGTGIDFVDRALSSFNTGYLGIEIPTSFERKN